MQVSFGHQRHCCCSWCDSSCHVAEPCGGRRPTSNCLWCGQWPRPRAYKIARRYGLPLVVLPSLQLALALLVAWTDPGPRGDMFVGSKARHIRANLRDDTGGRCLAHPRLGASLVTWRGIQSRANSASTSGSPWPPSKASSILCPLLPSTSAVTAVSLTLAVSSTFCSRLTSSARSCEIQAP